MSAEASEPMRGDPVTLREITAETVKTICRLEVRPEQRNFVAPNAQSIAEAHFSAVAWFRAVYAGDSPVGFVMLLDDPGLPRYYVWRFMIAGDHQGKGFGYEAMQQVIDYVRGRPGATELILSYVHGNTRTRDFYARLGFVETGREAHGEVEMQLIL